MYILQKNPTKNRTDMSMQLKYLNMLEIKPVIVLSKATGTVNLPFSG